MNDKIFVYCECHLNTWLMEKVISVAQLNQKFRSVHQKDNMQCQKKVIKSEKQKVVAFIDEDNKVARKYSDFAINSQEYGLIHYTQNNKHILVVCPAIEEWLINNVLSDEEHKQIVGNYMKSKIPIQEEPEVAKTLNTYLFPQPSAPVFQHLITILRGI